jgi:histidyl-tRNA synthetase
MGEIQALRGTRDILPDEVGYWQQVEATAQQILTRAVYQEIRTPILSAQSCLSGVLAKLPMW